MSFINPVHIAFVAIVALIVLGPKRFPEVVRSVGNGYREFREQLAAVSAQVQTDLTAPAAGTSTVEHVAVVEEISPDRDTLLAPPDTETSVTTPVAHVEPAATTPAGQVESPLPAPPAPPA